MPRQRNVVPTYGRHIATQQATCTVRLPNGQRKVLYLGRYNSAASKAEYSRIVSIVATNGGVYPTKENNLTVNEGLVLFGQFIDGYYVDANGKPTRTVENLKLALGYLRRLFGPSLLIEFGPPQIKTIRSVLINERRVRTQINKFIGQIRQFFRWCVEEEHIPPSILEALRAVRPLMPGRGGAKEGTPRQPADPAAVDRAIPLMPPAVRAIVQLLRLTGARPSEILCMRPCDLDRSKEVWIFSLAHHKGSWQLKTRTIHFGPDAQAVLSPWLLGTPADQYVFSPKRSEEIRSRERSDARVTPLWPSHSARNDRKRRSTRRRPPSDRYTAANLATAVRRACRRADVEVFTPYQLRYLRAVELRERYGLEVVRAVLGHCAASMSDHYSKAADGILASRAASEVG